MQCHIEQQLFHENSTKWVSKIQLHKGNMPTQQMSVFTWHHAVLQNGCFYSNGNQYSFMQGSFTLLCVTVSPRTSPFVVQAHDDRVRAWCAWLPWIFRSVCAIRRPCWRTAWRQWKCSITINLKFLVTHISWSDTKKRHERKRFLSVSLRWKQVWKWMNDTIGTDETQKRMR